MATSARPVALMTTSAQPVALMATGAQPVALMTTSAQPIALYTVSGLGAPGAPKNIEGKCAAAESAMFAIAAFTLPRTNLPLRVWSPQLGDSYTLVYNGMDREATVPVKYEYAGRPGPTDIWSVGQYLKMLNCALREAHEKLGGVDAGLGSAAPFISYDPATTLFRHHIPAAYGRRVSIYASPSVARLFGNMGGNNPLDSPKGALITDDGGVLDKDGRYTIITQEVPTAHAWRDMEEIVLNTNWGDVVLTDLAPYPSTFGREPFTFHATALMWRARPPGQDHLHIHSVHYHTPDASIRIRTKAHDIFRVTVACA